MCSTQGPDLPPHSLPHQENFFLPFMPRRHRPDFLTLFLFRNQSVTDPHRQPSIRTLIRQIEALGYKVIIPPWDIEWGDIPQEYWGIVVSIDPAVAHRTPPLPLSPVDALRRHSRQLQRRAIFLGSASSSSFHRCSVPAVTRISLILLRWWPFLPRLRAWLPRALNASPLSCALPAPRWSARRAPPLLEDPMTVG